MNIEHNSHSSIYRSPFGAVACGQKIRLRLLVSSFEAPSEVMLVMGGVEIPLHYMDELMHARVYEIEWIAPSSPSLNWYYFRVTADGVTLYYGNNPEMLGGCGTVSDTVPEKCYQITVYRPGYHTPDWMKHALVYQIFPDRFYRAGDTPIHGIFRWWGEEPYYRAEDFGGTYLSNDSFGGNFDGIIEKLPYIKSLGMNTIYLNPIFQAFSNHKYDTGDYENVDETFGGNEAFDRLVEACDKEGIRLILDGVFNHTGSDSRYFNKEGHYDSLGAYQSKDSPYYSWYNFTEYPDKYDCWWGFLSLPHTNELDPSFLGYTLTGKDSIVKRWLRRGASGWRLDVVDELPDEYVKILRKAVKEENPDAVIIGEVWEDASNKISYGEQREYLLGDELDSAMNYPLRSAILSYAMGEIDAWRFTRELTKLYENYPKEAFYSMLNLIDSHDRARAITVLAGAPDFPTREEQAAYTLSPKERALGIARLKIASFLQFTLPGAPCLYYGDEVGMEGHTDPFNRRCFPWGNEDERLIHWYQSLAKKRNTHPALRTGEYQTVVATGKTLVFLRTIQGGKDAFGHPQKNETLLCAINAGETICQLDLDLGKYGLPSIHDFEIGAMKCKVEVL